MKQNARQTQPAGQHIRARQQKTTIMNREEHQRTWFLLDAKGKTLGRFAAEASKILRGKHRSTFTQFADVGDGVIIINAQHVCVTGNKEAQKLYRHYTGYMSGLREIPYRVMKARHPTEMLRRAIVGMLPKTRLAEAQKRRLRIFPGAEHDMISQKPVQANI